MSGGERTANQPCLCLISLSLIPGVMASKVYTRYHQRRTVVIVQDRAYHSRILSWCRMIPESVPSTCPLKAANVRGA